MIGMLRRAYATWKTKHEIASWMRKHEEITSGYRRRVYDDRLETDAELRERIRRTIDEGSTQ